MSHIAFPHPEYPRRHPGATTLGNRGFYAALGIVAVSLLILFGIYELAQGALMGVADLARDATS